MKNAIQITLYRNSNNTGSIVFKSYRQHYKITCAQQLLPFAANMEQLFRAIAAGARQQNGFFVLHGCLQSQWLLQYDFENESLRLKLLEDTEEGAQQLVFNWQGGFDDFKDGFKIF